MARGDRRRSSDFNERVIADFRANHGRVGGELADTSILLLHHVGARSGVQRVTPLAYNRLGDGQIVIVASNGGSPTHPAWYRNLKTAVRADSRGLIRATHLRAPRLRRAVASVATI